MGERLGQGFVVENRTGAGGSLGGAEVARATDGHTFLWDASSHIVNPSLLRGLPFDYATGFTPISLVVTFPSVIAVKNDLPARTLAEFVAAAKARPGTITVGMQGNATAGHLGLAAFARAAGIKVNHVPYRGGAAAAQDLAAGAIDAVFTTLVSAGPVVDGNRAGSSRSGRSRASKAGRMCRPSPSKVLPVSNPTSGLDCSDQPARRRR
jgi:tripartite-type tricarboxylate transporter receptor subunit TctC